jgi:hypothetical protein
MLTEGLGEGAADELADGAGLSFLSFLPVVPVGMLGMQALTARQAAMTTSQRREGNVPRTFMSTPEPGDRPLGFHARIAGTRNRIMTRPPFNGSGGK